jgi:hypothetical protein
MAKVAVATCFGCCVSIRGLGGTVWEAKTFCFMAGIHPSVAGYIAFPITTTSIIRSRIAEIRTTVFLKVVIF